MGLPYLEDIKSSLESLRPCHSARCVAQIFVLPEIRSRQVVEHIRKSLRESSAKKKYYQALDPPVTYTVSSLRRPHLQVRANHGILCNKDLSELCREYWS